MAGAVPIYWGDAPLDPEVFNSHRIIYYDGTNASVTERIRYLETDPEFRAAWFAEPVLTPNADAWLENWCDKAGGLIADAYADVLKTRKQSSV